MDNRIHAVVDYVQSLARPAEPIFDFSNQPALYFFANRPNPTRFYQVPILSPPAFQAETIRALEHARPKVVIRRSPEGFDTFDGVSNNTRAQAVAAYLDDCYAFYRNARGIEIWRRRPDAVAAPVAQYVSRIVLPKSSERVDPGFSREVFPLIGSGPGVGGAYWQSDLTMQNPQREPIHVTLRYVSADQRIDRRIVLGGGRTIRWDDVVRSLFQMPQSSGSLWIEYVNGRAPVVVAHSWDSVHDAHGSIDSPLTMSDTATAGSPRTELAFLGIPKAAAPGRRINIAVVNLGTIPATFSISATSLTGAKIGRPIVSGVQEDDVWVVQNVEAELGTTIDEGSMIRVSVIAGTGVAYASVIQPNGDILNIAAVPSQGQ